MKWTNSLKKQINFTNDAYYIIFFCFPNFCEISMNSCTTLGSTATIVCQWEFDSNCNVSKCYVGGTNRVWYNWNDCSANCCTLATYTWQAVENCIQSYNTKLAIGLSIGFGYPLIAVCFFLSMKDKTIQNFCLSLLWPILPFIAIWQFLKEMYENKKLARVAQQRPKPKKTLEETTNIIVIEQQNKQNKQIKNELKKIKELIKQQKQNNQQSTSEMCIVCCQRKRQVIGECLHMVFCKICCENVQKCPICRKPTIWKEVYIS